MILAVFYDSTMLTFLLVLTIGILAYADAFESIDVALKLEGLIEVESIENDQSNYEKYVKNYVVAWQKSFLASMGDFGFIENYRDIDFLVFLLCCLFNIITLLNLLIAIISDTYARIAENQVQNSYREKAVNISRMQAMIPYQMKQENPNELIFIAKVINSEDIEDIQKSDKIDHLTDELSEVKADLNTVISSVQTLKSDLDEIKKLLRK